jgi:starch synthase (maltosyl-transferring)
MTDGLAPDAASLDPVHGAPFDPGTRSRHILIQAVQPTVDGGRYPVKREVGDLLVVRAEIFREGHGLLTAVLKVRPDPAAPWTETPMRLLDNGLDLWEGQAPLTALGTWQYTIEAWTDHFGSWRHDTVRKAEAGQDVAQDIAEGRLLVTEALPRAEAGDHAALMAVLERLETAADDDARVALLAAPEVGRLMDRVPDRSDAVALDDAMEVIVEPVVARFAAWYTMFPRSQGTDPERSATFDDVIARIPEVAKMGFDVLYFTPIHPIGEMFRKGRNNTFPAKPGEPGSPYAIGSKDGGHKAIHPDLGTLADFHRVVAEAERHGMMVALDIAIQCAQDHPWITEHPEWFVFRPDGSIKYAENPPKKYQDIVNVDFHGRYRDSLWKELLSVFTYWCEQGVRIFRVDNPHTKPVPFWEWCLREVRKSYPDAVFLSEAFTRPTMLKALAKVGFSQSYTYFTWRNFKGELTDYLTDLVHGEAREYLRPNFHTCTPDILPEFLQRGGRPAFMIRAALAGTLSSLYGITNGYELCENQALPGKEEYLDSEKYQYKVRNWDRPGNIKDFLTRLNAIRKANPALHEVQNLRFHSADDDNVLFYSKATPGGDNMIFVAVTLDPFEPHAATLDFPLEMIGLGEDDAFQVEELFTGTRRLWRGRHHAVTLDPDDTPAAIFRVRPWKTVNYADPCY